MGTPKTVGIYQHGQTGETVAAETKEELCKKTGISQRNARFYWFKVVKQPYPERKGKVFKGVR
jgi:hypothetical protein